MQTLKILTLFLAMGMSTLAIAEEQSSTSTFPAVSKSETEEEWKPHMGLTAGFADPTDNYEGATEYGLDVGYQPFVPFGIGVEFTHFSSEKNSGLQNVEIERTKLLGRGTYNFGGTIPVIKNSFVGAALGPVFDHEDGKDKLNIGISSLLGVDFPLGGTDVTRKSFSLGATMSYLAVGGGAADTFGMNGLLKYWF
ncbi:MAG: hypothetical protein AB7H97_19705 [Pseudobdellovibrionaceae bacterium]